MPLWSRAELAEWVSGKQVYTRDARAANARAPEWLLEASEGWGPARDSAGAMERTYPEDRSALIRMFVAALGAPSEVVTGRIRVKDVEASDRWATVQVEWLNLLDDPDVGCVICALLDVGTESQLQRVAAETGDFTNTRWMVLDLNSAGVIRSVDGKVCEMIGYQPDELVGRVISEFIHHDALADGVANWVEMVGTAGATSTARRPWNIKGDGHIWLEAYYLNRGQDSVLAVAWDITEKRRQEQELAEITAQFRILADEVPAAVFRCDLEGRVLFHNARLTALVEARPEGARLHDLVADEDQARLSATLAALATDQAGERRTIDVSSPDGSAVWRVALRPAGDLAAGLVTVVGSIEDVTTTVRLQSEVRHDALTGVLNRHGLDERMADVVTSDPRALVVFIDLDGFKRVNDVYGHDVGDLVLKEVARRLVAGARPGDAVGRYGGDEFVVVCGDVGPGQETGIVRRFEESLAGTLTFEGGRWEVAASLGSARCSHGDDVATVLRRADKAMYEVKRRHRQALGRTH